MELRSLRERLKMRVAAELDLTRDVEDAEIARMIDRCILEETKDQYVPLKEKVGLRVELFNSLRRLDVLTELLEDETVTEIMVNGQSDIFVERDGVIRRYEKGFSSEERLETVIQHIVGDCNRRINAAVRKNSILEKSKTNYEIKQMIDDRQKALVFMTAEDMICNGLNSGRINIINNNYDPKVAEKQLIKTYAEIVVPAKYKKAEAPQSGGKFFGKNSGPAMDPDLQKLLSDTKIEEMLLKSEWLWNQYEDKGNDQQTPEEATYSVVCLIKVVEKLLDRKGGSSSRSESSPNKKVIITKTGKVIELSDEGAQTQNNNTTLQPTVIENLNNIIVTLKDKSDANVKYVQAYVNDWLNSVVDAKLDKNSMLQLYEAEELRNKTLTVIKKLRADLL